MHDTLVNEKRVNKVFVATILFSLVSTQGTQWMPCSIHCCFPSRCHHPQYLIYVLIDYNCMFGYREMEAVWPAVVDQNLAFMAVHAWRNVMMSQNGTPAHVQNITTEGDVRYSAYVSNHAKLTWSWNLDLTQALITSMTASRRIATLILKLEKLGLL